MTPGCISDPIELNIKFYSKSSPKTLKLVNFSRKVAAALFIHHILYGRIKFAYLTGLLHFESNLYPRRRNGRWMDFNHPINYGQIDKF
jgi:hypothetical protein